jgi:hypothetical protein
VVYYIPATTTSLRLEGRVFIAKRLRLVQEMGRLKVALITLAKHIAEDLMTMV